MSTDVKQVEINEVMEQPEGGVLLNSNLISLLGGLEVKVHAKIGNASVSVKAIKELKRGNILSLDTDIESELSLYFENNLIARGNLVAVDDSYALEVTQVFQVDS